MFHGWRVESKREERGKYERNTEKETERKLKGKPWKVTPPTKTLLKGKGSFSLKKISIHLLIFP